MALRQRRGRRTSRLFQLADATPADPFALGNSRSGCVSMLASRPKAVPMSPGSVASTACTVRRVAMDVSQFNPASRFIQHLRFTSFQRKSVSCAAVVRNARIWATLAVHLTASRPLTHSSRMGLPRNALQVCAVRSPYDLGPFFVIRVEAFVNRLSMRALTWGTLLAALLSAVLLAGEDAALPDLAPRGGVVVPSR